MVLLPMNTVPASAVSPLRADQMPAVRSLSLTT